MDELLVVLLQDLVVFELFVLDGVLKDEFLMEPLMVNVAVLVLEVFKDLILD